MHDRAMTESRETGTGLLRWPSIMDLLMTSLVGPAGRRVDFLFRSGLCGDNFRFKFGLAQRSISASLYSSFHETDSVFSTTSRTLGESGSCGTGVDVDARGRISNFPGGAETGRCPVALLKNLESNKLFQLTAG